MTDRETGGPKRTRPGRQALFSNSAGSETGASPTAATADAATGRRAVFSASTRMPPEPEADRTSAVVHCRTCLAATKVSVASLGMALLPSVWVPLRPWPRLMRCPACHHRSWCRIDWPKLL